MRWLDDPRLPDTDVWGFVHKVAMLRTLCSLKQGTYDFNGAVHGGCSIVLNFGVYGLMQDLAKLPDL